MFSENEILSLRSELTFQTSRSSGAGGQHVNKVNTRVELRFPLTESATLNANQKQILMHKLANRINARGELIIASEATRSQSRNKEDSVERFFELLSGALKPTKKRIATKPSYQSRKARLESKRRNSTKKQFRQKPDI